MAPQSPFRVDLLGYPLDHSVSPWMHQAAARALGIDLDYQLRQVSGELLGQAVARLRDYEYLGANVTLPHKPAMLALVDSLTPLARRIGALNTVYKRDGRLVGENTDAPAMLRCLRESLALQPSEEQVVIIGAGGAARAAAVALMDADVRVLGLFNRTGERASQLYQSLLNDSPSRSDRVMVITPVQLEPMLRHATLLVNATSIGLDGISVPIDVGMLPGGARVFDMVYGPSATPLVRAARGRGLPAMDGLAMLVFQASRAFTLWTSQEAPEHVMYDAAIAAFHERAGAVPRLSSPAARET